MRYLAILLLLSTHLLSQSQIGAYTQVSASSLASNRNFDAFEPVFNYNFGILYNYQNDKWLYILGLEHLKLGAKQLQYYAGSRYTSPYFSWRERSYYFVNSNLALLRKVGDTENFDIYAGLGLNLGHAYNQSFKSTNHKNGLGEEVYFGPESLPYNFYLAPELTMRIDYRINQYMDCFIAPSYSYQIRQDLDFHSFGVFQLNTGILYNL